MAEVRLGPLVEAADLVPRHVPLSPYPAVTRDLNLVVDEAVRWAEVAATVRHHGGRGPGGPRLSRHLSRPRSGSAPAKKACCSTIALRSKEGTLTSPQADAVRDRIVAACGAEHGATLRA